MYDGIKNVQCNKKPIGAQIANKGHPFTIILP